MAEKRNPLAWTRLCAPFIWLAVLQVLVVTLLAVAPKLHEHFHVHSNDGDHHCLVVEFQAGSVAQPTPTEFFTPRFEPVLIAVTSATHEVLELPCPHLLGNVLERGPPASA
jgi:hypothetical protein